MLRAAVVLLFVGCFVAVMSGAASAECPNPPQPQLATSPIVIETARGRFDITVELATSATERACGFMKRPRLGSDAGMLFRQPSIGPAYFWMKNTPQPLDIIFLDAAGLVLHWAEFTTPYSTNVYGIDGPVAAVLELRAGMSARLSLQLGDRVEHRWFR